MKQLYFSLVLFLFIATVYSQQNTIDSLKMLLRKASTDKEKLEALSELSKELISKGEPKESLPYFEDLAKLANKQKDFTKEFMAYRYISESYIKLNDSTKAYEFANKSHKDKNDVNDYLLAMNQLGRAYDHFNDYKKAVETYELGIKLYEQKGENQKFEVISKILLNQSQAYKDLNQHEKAIESMLKGLKYAESIEDQTGIAFGLYNIGWYYMTLEDFEKAESYLLKSLTYADDVVLPIYVNINHHALGINYSRWEKFDKAIEHNEIALENFQKTGNDIYAFDVLNNTSVVYSKMKDFDKASEFAKRALKIAEKLNHKKAILGAKHTLARVYLIQDKPQEAELLLKEIIKDTLTPNAIIIDSKRALFEDLSATYEKQNNHKLALTYYKRYTHITDSLAKIEKKDQFTEIETRYQVEKKENENLQLKAEKAQQELLTQKANAQKWILALGLLMAAIAAFLIWKRYKAEAKAKQVISSQKDEIEKQKNTVETLQKELHHRMKNNLSFIDLFINLAKAKFPDKAYQDKLNDLQNRMRSMFEVHKQLFKKDDVTSVQAKNYIDTLTDNIREAYAKPNVTIVNKTSENETLLGNSSFTLGLIINEFVTNSFKYAFDDTGNGTINISLASDDKNHTLELKDNGKGLPKNFDINSLDSFGMETIQLLTKEYNGTFALDGSEGIRMTITLPKTTA